MPSIDIIFHSLKYFFHESNDVTLACNLQGLIGDDFEMKG